MLRVLNSEEAETAARALPECPACGRPKATAASAGLVVCWSCFKTTIPKARDVEEVDGLKYDGGEFADWLARYRGGRRLAGSPGLFASAGAHGFALMQASQPLNDGRMSLEEVAAFAKTVPAYSAVPTFPLLVWEGRWALVMDVAE